MCNSVIAQGREYGTPRKLAAFLGGEDRLVWQGVSPFARWPKGKDWHDLDLCLCGIDLAATLSKAGLRWHRDDDDPMEYIVD